MITGPGELVHSERVSVAGGYGPQRGGVWIGAPGLHICGGGT